MMLWKRQAITFGLISSGQPPKLAAAFIVFEGHWPSTVTAICIKRPPKEQTVKLPLESW